MAVLYLLKSHINLLDRDTLGFWKCLTIFKANLWLLLYEETFPTVEEAALLLSVILRSPVLHLPRIFSIGKK